MSKNKHLTEEMSELIDRSMGYAEDTMDEILSDVQRIAYEKDISLNDIFNAIGLTRHEIEMLEGCDPNTPFVILVKIATALDTVFSIDFVPLDSEGNRL